MRRQILLTVVLAVAFVSCSPSGAGPTTHEQTHPSMSQPSSSEEPRSTTDPIDSTSTSVTGITDSTSGRPLAPDFTLELGEGGAFTLSEGAKPVYLVFWAEW